jgi:hypothetical protein
MTSLDLPIVKTKTLIAMLFVLCGMIAAPARAEQEAIGTTLDLGFDLAKAGEQVSLAVQFNAPEKVKVGTTTNVLTFPTKLLSVTDVRAATMGQTATETDIKWDSKPDPKDAEKTVVQVTVTGKNGAAIAPGVIASIVFKITEKTPAQTVKIGNSVSAMTAGAQPAKIDAITGTDGEIEILESEINAVLCFFYMH